jgi:hypothetical protein
MCFTCLMLARQWRLEGGGCRCPCGQQLARRCRDGAPLPGDGLLLLQCACKPTTPEGWLYNVGQHAVMWAWCAVGSRTPNVLAIMKVTMDTVSIKYCS